MVTAPGPRGAGSAPDPSGRGHRALDHTADLIVEAWGPSRAACLEEALAALVATFASWIPDGDASGDGGAARPPSAPADTADRPVRWTATSDDELLVVALEEVLYLVDALGLVPVDASLHDDGTDGVAGRLVVVPVASVETTGPGPKGVSRSGARLRDEDGRWRARALVDV